MNTNVIIKSSAILLTFVFSTTAMGQTIQDGLRYSFTRYGGTARSMGVGNSLGALGADFSTLSINPAGIASYRKSEFMLTPSTNMASTESVFEGKTEINKKSALQLANLGVVFVTIPRNSKWKTANFGVGINRLANFGQRFTFQGTTKGSIANYFLDQAQGYLPEQLNSFGDSLALATDLIYRPDQNRPAYYENDIYEDDRLHKSQKFDSKGAMSELVLSLGGNLDDKLYLGATLGIDFLKYTEQRAYVETDKDESVQFFNQLDFKQNLQVIGTGINLKLGAIYRASQALRLGFAFHTPTGFLITETYNNSMQYDITYQNGSNIINRADSPEGTFAYRLATPWKVIGSGAYIFDNKGFISAEVEWIDYASMNFSVNEETASTDDVAYMSDLNNIVADQLNAALNIRLGGEVALDKFRARAGYSLVGNPYIVDDSKPNNALHFGLGLRENNFYIDAAYTISSAQETYIPYLAPAGDAQPVINNDFKNGQFLLTIGVKFDRRSQKNITY